MPGPTKPTEVSIRAYQVGFGDCFLVGFRYPNRMRHLLIDFGTTGTPDGKDKARLVAVAKDIRERTGSKLEAVVASHRHRDHIAGFDPSGKDGAGKIIASCEPEVVLQPWTEDPRAARNAKAPTRKNIRAVQEMMLHMQDFAGVALAESKNGKVPPGIRSELAFLGQDNLPNLAAVKQLQALGKRHVYAYAGSNAGLGRLFPGVKVHVLGPPTLEQTDTILKQRSTDPDEFWQLQAGFWSLQASATSGRQSAPIFDSSLVDRHPSPEARWFIRRAARARSEQTLQLVRSVDRALNNTSLILLFEVGRLRLLFPGDAQIENWSYALDQEKYRKLLRDVTFYKVGHHGSRNATPRSLWESFAHKSAKKAASRRLSSMVSTMAGKHGSPERKTEVPRQSLVRALRRYSDYHSTESIRSKKLDASREVVLKC